MSPDIEIFGAYFPGWLIAGVAGIILAALSKAILGRLGIHRHLVCPVLVYICLAFLWAGVCWIVFFSQ